MEVPCRNVSFEGVFPFRSCVNFRSHSDLISAKTVRCEKDVIWQIAPTNTMQTLFNILVSTSLIFNLISTARLSNPSFFSTKTFRIMLGKFSSSYCARISTLISLILPIFSSFRVPYDSSFLLGIYKVSLRNVFSAHGEMENRIKDTRLYLLANHMSSYKFCSNQLRLLLSCSAYVLLNDLCRTALPTRNLQRRTTIRFGRVSPLWVRTSLKVFVESWSTSAACPPQSLFNEASAYFHLPTPPLKLIGKPTR